MKMHASTFDTGGISAVKCTNAFKIGKNVLGHLPPKFWKY